MVLCFYSDAVTFEEVQGIFCEAFVKHWKNLGSHIVYRDLDVGNEVWVEFSEIFVAEIEEFCSEFNSSG